MSMVKLPVVQTAGLCKTFRDFWRRPRVEAVKHLSMEIRPGEVFGLLGPNGSGKSTAIKLLLGLLYPTRGRIALFGKSPTDVEVKSRIGFLPEETYLYRFLVASETLDYFGRLFRLSPKVRKERTEMLLDMVGLKHEARRPLGEYSKGMARRIGLAQALINDPEFLILDEPTSGLDPIGARQIKDVIRELGDRGKTILLSSHMLSDVEDVCDRVTILYGGQQRAAGDIGELLRKSDLTTITTEALAPETVEEVRRTIQRLEHKDIVKVSNPRDKLEDLFLRIVKEAQQAKIKTSGAQTGGATPEFLSKATASESGALIESLMSAAQASAPEAAELEVPAEPQEDPSREVLDQLTGVGQEDEADQPAVPPPARVDSPQDGPGSVASAYKDDATGLQPPKPIDADESVLNSLLSGDRQGDDDASKDDA